MLALEVVGESVRLSANRALHLPEHSAVIVADLHWGKSATFRANGMLVPPGVTAHDLERLTQVLSDTAAERLIVVGDMLHAKVGRHERTLKAIATWRAQHASLAMVLVRGNHDERAGDPPAEWKIECVDGPLLVGGFACQHHPGVHDTHYVLAGHLHPHALLRGRGRQGLRLPCFAFGARGAVLPAFTSFTGSGAYIPDASDKLFVIADGEVLQTR
jgi:DNA ligase-associated metallophosphoesterase